MIYRIALPVLILFLAACSNQRQGGSNVQAAAVSKPEPITVRVSSVETRAVDRTIAVTGSLLPDDTISISAEVPGRVESIRFDFGQPVRKGEVIAQLDQQEYRLQVERSRASLTQALARVGLSPEQAGTIPATTPAIRQAEAAVDDAKSKFDSGRNLVASGDIARERFTELEKALAAKQAALDAARDELRTLLANIQALRAETRLAEKRLSDTIIRAPFDGSVAERLVALGQYIKENTPIVRLVKPYPLRLRVEIPETAAGSVGPGTSLRFTTDAIAGREFSAVVRELNPGLDARSRSLTVEARLTDNDPRLRPGMFVQVGLTTVRNQATLVIPKSALYSVAGLNKVFTISGNQVREHKVALGRQQGEWVEISSDAIHAGDSVATSNVGALTDGIAVRVQKAGS
jgi:membrane fusion protein, multidrug efflux system